jgi:glyoxylase-like metal-dependent hydrolase (beta-lactamase superfamily II)
MLSGRGGLVASTRLVCHCLLIEGAEGLILVDTGFGSGDIARPRQLGAAFSKFVRPRLLAEETAHAQILALGMDPADVRHVVTTHLDPDHSGGLPDFPAAEVHLLGKELSEALSPGWRDRQRYIAAHWSHGPRWVEHEAGGDDWFGFEGIRILPGSAAEILLIPLPGHTAGHTGVAVRDGSGWLLHCGDAYYHRGDVETPPRCPPGLRAFASLTQVDGALRRANLERLRELAARHAEEVTLLCSHDAKTLQRLSAPG